MLVLNQLIYTTLGVSYFLYNVYILLIAVLISSLNYFSSCVININLLIFLIKERWISTSATYKLKV